MKTCCFPYGAIVAAAMYGIAIYIFYYNDWIKDEHYFAQDFYLGVWSMLLGAHFLYCKYGSQVTNDCWMILVLMGIGYVLRGVASKEFSSNGQGEGELMWAYFIVWPISYLFLTLSIYQFSFHTRKMWCLLHGGFLQPRRCGIFEVIASETMVVITFIVILIGSVWSLSSDDIFNNNDSHSSSSEVSDPPSVQLVTYGTLFWLVSQLIFWGASASIQGILAREKPPVSVFGMPNTMAATSIVVLQLGTGAFWVTVQVIKTQKVLEIFDETFWSILYHFVMVMTAFFIHNLMSTVKVEGDDNSKAESTGTDVLESSSSEHLASSESESVSEGITFESSVGSTFNSLAYDSSIERTDLNLMKYRESDTKIKELNESVLEDGKETDNTERLNDSSDMPESPVERFVRVGTDLMKALVHKSSNIETDHDSKNLNSVEDPVHQPKHDIEAGTEKGKRIFVDNGDMPDYDHDKLSRAKVSKHKVPKQKRSRTYPCRSKVDSKRRSDKFTRCNEDKAEENEESSPQDFAGITISNFFLPRFSLPPPSEDDSSTTSLPAAMDTWTWTVEDSNVTGSIVSARSEDQITDLEVDQDQGFEQTIDEYQLRAIKRGARRGPSLRGMLQRNDAE